MKVNEIIKLLELAAPPQYALSWDNPGLLVGRKDAEVSCVYIALDATEHAIEEAISAEAQLLITHHPMIFSPIKQINDQGFIGRRILNLIENHISCYAMHTNFDVAAMGWIAADQLALKQRQVLEETIPEGTMGNKQAMGIGCVGELPYTMTLKECGEYVKKAFQIPSVKIFGNLNTMVSRAALCPGSGKHMTQHAIQCCCDVLITGDIDHHEGIDANSQGIQIIDAGHHGIEHIFVDYMAGFLKEKLPDIRIVKEGNCPPFTVL